ncbi:MAG TPA: hypothetical protein VJL60_06170 [Gammaproteobacteria bacterium]|nr:hypothetical protein [Gammaproteobacteria bacterium]
MLDERKYNILMTIINEYVRCAQPIGSELVVERCKLDVSPATVRNEMLALDEEGYLEKTHTSSGRIPTERAFHYFISHNFTPKKISEQRQLKLKEGLARLEKNPRNAIKIIAKNLSTISQEFIVAAFSDNDFYYTGLTNLFSQPEFRHQTIICNISSVIDHLDTRLRSMYHTIGEDTDIAIGSKNPIDATLSFIGVKVYNAGPLLGILGPMRMDYRENVALINFCKQLLSAGTQ